MAGPVLHASAVVTCTHGAPAAPAEPVARVTLSGMPVATTAAPYVVTGCSFVPTNGNGPCLTGRFAGAVHVTVLGEPVVLATSSSMCDPTGTPLLTQSSQTRVLAT